VQDWSKEPLAKGAYSHPSLGAYGKRDALRYDSRSYDSRSLLPVCQASFDASASAMPPGMSIMVGLFCLYQVSFDTGACLSTPVGQLYFAGEATQEGINPCVHGGIDPCVHAFPFPLSAPTLLVAQLDDCWRCVQSRECVAVCERYSIHPRLPMR